MLARWRKKRTRLPQVHPIREYPGAMSVDRWHIAANMEKVLDLPPRPVVGGRPWWQSPLLKETFKKNGVEYVTRDYPVAYQRRILEEKLDRESLYLKWAGGAGKTVAALFWAAANADEHTKVLVITQAGAKVQWEIATARHTSWNPVLVYGRSNEEFESSARLLITNWEIIAENEEAFTNWLLLSPDRILILDEVHKGKNHKRVQKYIDEADGELKFKGVHTTAATMARLSRVATRRLGLSATPYSVSLMDLWSQLDALEPDCWGSGKKFGMRYCDAKPGEHGGLDTTGASNTDELRLRLDYIMDIVSRKEMEAQLPGKVRELIYLKAKDLGKAFKEHREFVKAAAAYGQESLWEAQVAVSASMKRPWTSTFAAEKLMAGERIVILTNRHREVEELADAIIGKLPKELHDSVMWSHGGSPLAERERQRVRFENTTEPLLLVGTHDAWGQAIDGLQNTTVGIMNSLPTTPKILNQSETRWTRLGQRSHMTIYYAIAEGTIDETMNERLLNRLDILVEVLDGEEESDSAKGVLSGLADSDRLLEDILDGLGLE